uniref:Uncharacterized protein n=1 Tax=Panagrolaimus sp. ES5 TaxID=591445 RepID=A0AC34FLW0_9BILA
MESEQIKPNIQLQISQDVGPNPSIVQNEIINESSRVQVVVVTDTTKSSTKNLCTYDELAVDEMMQRPHYYN